MASRLNSDPARKWTDAELESLERRMRREYYQAAREMRGKQAEWLEKFNREREQREKALDDTKEAMEAHKAWLQSQAARGDWLGGMATQLAESAHQANVRAMEMVNGHIPRVFSENANRAAFSVDKMLKADTGFTLVNEEAVRHVMEAGLFDAQLIREVVPNAPELGPAAMQSLRMREVDYPKDMRWNRQKFTSAITQGILQGESIPNIVKRTESIYGQNRNAAIRAARTATTNAENAGRMNSFERAQKLGIDMEIEWEATLDDRTRESHAMLDGERVKVGEAFETDNGPIRWPGDPLADPAETWNCRCRADGQVVGFDGKRGDWADEVGERWSRLPEDTTYEQWEAGKAVSAAEGYEGEADMVSGEWLQDAQNYQLANPIESDIIETAAQSAGYAPIDLADAIEEIESGKTNSLAQWVEGGELSPERKAVHDSIIDDLLEGKTPTGEQPKMTMLGGGPASGKSSVMNPDTKGNPHAITVDPDDMKKRLPGFAEMAEVDTNAAAFYHEESSALAKRFSEVAYSRHIDAIYDGTGDGSVRSVMKKVNAARENGYSVEAKYVTIDTDEAIRRNRKRYDDAVARGETPRLPPEDMVRSTHAKVTDISVELAPEFDRIEVWDNNGGRGEQVMIAVGGKGRWLKPIEGQEAKFEAYLRKGEQGIGRFEKLPDGSWKPKEA